MKDRLYLLLSLMLLPCFALAGDVTMYDKAPSVEELQKQLSGSDGSDRRKKFRTRSIVFGDSPSTAAAAEAPLANPTPVQSNQQTAAGPGQVFERPSNTPRISDRAIAFPINFCVNSSNILPESVPFLESIAGLLLKDPAIRLVVEGHTDTSGNPARNIVLSWERAIAVMSYLIDRHGIDPMRLIPVGKGFSESLSGLESSNPKNRRVQFRIVG